MIGPISSQNFPMTMNMGDMGVLNDLLAAQPGNRMVGNDLFVKQRSFPSFGLFGQKPQMPQMPNPFMSGPMPDLMAQDPIMQNNVSFAPQEQPGFGENLQKALMQLYLMRQRGMR